MALYQNLKDDEIKDRIKNNPHKIEVVYEPRYRSFVLYDFNDTAHEGAEGRVRYQLSKELLLELLIEHGEFVS